MPEDVPEPPRAEDTSEPPQANPGIRGKIAQRRKALATRVTNVRERAARRIERAERAYSAGEKKVVSINRKVSKGAVVTKKSALFYQRNIAPAHSLSRRGGLVGIAAGDRNIGRRRGSYHVPIYGIGANRYPSARGNVPKGVIKSHWSKKVKTLARGMVQTHGSEEGIRRTRAIANELGWKMK